MHGQGGIDIGFKKFNFVKKLKNFYIFFNENAPSRAFLLNFYKMPFFEKAKLKKRMIMPRLTKWETELELIELLAVKILSKPL